MLLCLEVERALKCQMSSLFTAIKTAARMELMGSATYSCKGSSERAWAAREFQWSSGVLRHGRYSREVAVERCGKQPRYNAWNSGPLSSVLYLRLWYSL